MSKRVRTNVGPTQFVQQAVRKKVRKGITIVRDAVQTNMDVGTGANALTTTLFRCGQVVTNVGAVVSEFVNDSCTMVRFIYNGGFVVEEASNVGPSVTTIFTVVARVEAGNNLVTRFRVNDNELITSSFSNVEDIFYSGAMPLRTAESNSASPGSVKLNIDMKAKRRLNTGDAIVMFNWSASDAGNSNQTIRCSGVATVIAT